MASLWVACHGTKLFCCFGPFSCRGRGLSYYRMYKPYSNLQLQMKRVRWVPSPTHSQNQFLMALFRVNKFQLDSFKLERLCEPRVLQVYFGLKGSLSGLLCKKQKHTHLPHFGHKKSWLRVVRRVATHGSARYRGRWWTSKHISQADLQYVQSQTAHSGTGSGKSSCSQHSRQHRQAGSSPKSCSSRSFRFMTWNCGGLPAHTFDEILAYSRQCNLDMIALVETRRQQSLNWRSGEYVIIQCGEDTGRQSYSGVMLMIRRAEEVRFRHLVAGRLLQVTFSRPDLPVPMDVIVAYQKWVPCEAMAPAAAELIEETRMQVWSELDQALAAIPRRHPLIVLGDFNTHVGRAPPIFPSEFPCTVPSHDADEMVEICLRHDLWLQWLGMLVSSSSARCPSHDLAPHGRMTNCKWLAELNGKLWLGCITTGSVAQLLPWLMS